MVDGGWGVGENVLKTLRKEKGRGQREHRAIARLFGSVETGSGAFNSHLIQPDAMLWTWWGSGSILLDRRARCR